MASEINSTSLSKLFDDGFKLYDEIENSPLASNSDEYQVRHRSWTLRHDVGTVLCVAFVVSLSQFILISLVIS